MSRLFCNRCHQVGTVSLNDYLDGVRVCENCRGIDRVADAFDSTPPKPPVPVKPLPCVVCGEPRTVGKMCERCHVETIAQRVAGRSVEDIVREEDRA